nr:high mobility group B protein 3-like isoform X2 [Coffea arabica]
MHTQFAVVLMEVLSRNVYGFEVYCGERCGRSVAIALADMHECESNNSLKKLKGQRQSGNVKSQNIEDQPRSAFRFFMEELLDIHKEENEIAIDSKGFEMWKKMSKQERQPYLVKAEKVNSAHTKALLEEENDMSWVDDEADSAEVGKYDENYAEDGYFDGFEDDICDDPHDSDSFLFWSEISDSFDSKNWAKKWSPNPLRT